MRRARLKVVPNVGSLSRSTFKVDSESVPKEVHSNQDVSENIEPNLESASQVSTESVSKISAETVSQVEPTESAVLQPTEPTTPSAESVLLTPSSSQSDLSSSQPDTVPDVPKEIPPKNNLLQKLNRLKAKPKVNVTPRVTSFRAPIPDLPVPDTLVDLKETITETEKNPVTDCEKETEKDLEKEAEKENEHETDEENEKDSAKSLPESRKDSGKIPQEVQKNFDLTAVEIYGTAEPKEKEPISTVVEQNKPGSLHRFKSKPINKIRPNIESTSHRIRTYSSASESEDEGRRQLHSRTRSPSLKNSEPSTQPTTSIVKRGVWTKKGLAEAKAKLKLEEKSQLESRKEDMRKKFAKGQVELSQMTMFDLIYYNPDGEKPTRSKERVVTRRRMFESESPQPTKDLEVDGLLEEQLADDGEEGLVLEGEQVAMHIDGEGKENRDEPAQDEEDDDDSAMPVPQVRLGPNGEIVLDEMSLVIETNETKRRKTELANAPVIIENNAGMVNYGSWRKRKRSTKWSVRETAKFYRALGMLGTDFSLMESLFPRRTRFELKRKFKMEEKVNRQLIDKTISTQKPFDISVFGDESDDQSDADSTQSKTYSKKRGSRKAAVSSEVEEADELPLKKKRKKKTTSKIDSENDEANGAESQAGTTGSNCSLLTSMLKSPLARMSLKKSRFLSVGQKQVEQVEPNSLTFNSNDPVNHLVHA